MKNGHILAVNGPPGTGKTTLLQSVIASLWVEAAVNETEPPVIVAASANNQAVTNIIDSFGKIDESSTSCLSGRWLKEINSYGLFCPSKQKIKDLKDKFQMADCSIKNGGPFPKEVENRQYVEDNKLYFKSKFSKYSKKRIPSLHLCLKFLHDDLKETVSKINDGVNLFYGYTTCKEKLNRFFGGLDGLEQYVKSKKQEIAMLRNKIDEIKAVENGWLRHFSTENLLLSLFSFLPFVRNRIIIRNKLYYNSTNFKIEVPSFMQREIFKFIEQKKNILEDKKKKKANDCNAAMKAKYEFENFQKLLLNWIDSNKIIWEKKKDANIADREIEINNFYDLLAYIDTGLRYKAFKIATHYWECRWLIQMDEQINSGYEDTKGKEKSKRKWQRYAKLTPCIVSTFYMIPKFFTAWQGNEMPLYNFIDLLIIDEAGQVPPEIAGAAFSLAKKALVVGDTLQIEPVWSITKRVDIANMQKHNIITFDSDKEIDTFCESGMAVSCGNVMKIAQRASMYQMFSFERGMFLSEHRRCFDDIIRYCNELAYNGRLEPMRGNAPKMLLPYMGHMDIKGKAKRSGGSWGNQREAEVIALWIKEHREELEHFYTKRDEKKRKQDIKDIIGVVTPFAYQGRLIRAELNKLKIEDVTVGTVHSLQGAERNVIIFSPVYDSSQNSRKFFFDNGPNMLNVAVSRAKDSFLIFGDMEIFDATQNTPSGILAKYIKTPI